jgi:hypothetical protein
MCNLVVMFVAVSISFCACSMTVGISIHAFFMAVNRASNRAFMIIDRASNGASTALADGLSAVILLVGVGTKTSFSSLLGSFVGMVSTIARVGSVDVGLDTLLVSVADQSRASSNFSVGMTTLFWSRYMRVSPPTSPSPVGGAGLVL